MTAQDERGVMLGASPQPSGEAIAQEPVTSELRELAEWLTPDPGETYTSLLFFPGENDGTYLDSSNYSVYVERVGRDTRIKRIITATELRGAKQYVSDMIMRGFNKNTPQQQVLKAARAMVTIGWIEGIAAGHAGDFPGRTDTPPHHSHPHPIHSSRF